ncbi:DUF6434 domain-containing protein [Bacillus mexicanus]|uniref:DUF6434 domain-containing protein n=1 Tax=Bacillus mexicanus TaxID=2834415 RepID=UPI003D1931A8
MRPTLDKNVNIEKFKDYYWLKEELQTFCRQHGISASGSKEEITDRIVVFLETGEIKKPLRKTSTYKKTDDHPLSLDTVIQEGHKCSQKAREFFKSVIGPSFHFSTYIQNFFKQNVGKTYKDAVEAWYEEEKRKKEPGYKKEIGTQFEYNQFTRDFFSDPANKGKNRADAIAAWKEIKRLPGDNIYRHNN